VQKLVVNSLAEIEKDVMAHVAQKFKAGVKGKTHKGAVKKTSHERRYQGNGAGRGRGGKGHGGNTVPQGRGQKKPPRNLGSSKDKDPEEQRKSSPEETSYFISAGGKVIQDKVNVYVLKPRD